ncbi:hypothetical protein [Frigoriglobus tundricola]|uniref:Uncharacterized protein n=1 Tax=Frigoriglobus tundricola TaxID=2774151 RepID=A0A6M5YN63_9BACT|nr:hypothetical protein [Frigoriglobus tundricola]QJW94776.1 hypothetical protein FTUN_2299 [Frigoriglobus tundricola]
MLRELTVAVCSPRAARFAFGVTVSVYNALQAVKGALVREHGADVPDQLSGAVMAEDAGRTWDGLDLAIAPREWSALSALSPPAFGRWLQGAQGK